MFNFGENLKYLRKSKSLTQEQVAECFGVSTQAISKWETNVSYPDITLIPIIAGFYGVSTDELLGYNSEKREESILNICSKVDTLIDEMRYVEAIALLRNAMMHYPRNEELMYRLAWALTGTIKETPENLDEAITIYVKILEISTNTELRNKVTRDLMYRYYTKGDIGTALMYANKLPQFDVCKEYNLGRGNLFEGQQLSLQLQDNIKIYANAILECLEYYEKGNIISSKEMLPYTPEIVRKKIEAVRIILK